MRSVEWAIYFRLPNTDSIYTARRFRIGNTTAGKPMPSGQAMAADTIEELRTYLKQRGCKRVAPTADHDNAIEVWRAPMQRAGRK